MPRKQYRRSFSASRAAYDATRALATERGVTTSHLVELALLAYGVVFEPGEHQTPDIASRASEGKLWALGASGEERAARRREKERKRYREKAERAGRTVRGYHAVRLVEAPAPEAQAAPKAERVESRGGGELRAPSGCDCQNERLPAKPMRPSLERQMLGDQLADAMGWR